MTSSLCVNGSEFCVGNEVRLCIPCCKLYWKNWDIALKQELLQEFAREIMLGVKK